MNRRQQPQNQPPQRPGQGHSQHQRRPVQQQQPPPQQQQKYSPNVASSPQQIPPQVSIPQAISILVARINFLENKMASSNSVESDNSVSEESSRIASQHLEEMSSRIVKLELELLTTKDHILKLQSLALEQTLALRAATTTTVTPASADI